MRLSPPLGHDTSDVESQSPSLSAYWNVPHLFPLDIVKCIQYAEDNEALSRFLHGKDNSSQAMIDGHLSKINIGCRGDRYNEMALETKTLIPKWRVGCDCILWRDNCDGRVCDDSQDSVADSLIGLERNWASAEIDNCVAKDFRYHIADIAESTSSFGCFLYVYFAKHSKQNESILSRFTFSFQSPITVHQPRAYWNADWSCQSHCDTWQELWWQVTMVDDYVGRDIGNGQGNTKAQ